MNSVIKLLVVNQPPADLTPLLAALRDIGFSPAEQPARLEDARMAVQRNQPDVLVLHVQPSQEGACEGFVQALMADESLQLPVVALCRDALVSRRMIRAGAVDAMLVADVRDGWGSAATFQKFVHELSVKLKLASTVKLKRWKAKNAANTMPIASAAKGEASPPSKLFSSAPIINGGIIAIGASTGGTEATFSILRQLAPNIPGIVVVQHMPPGFTRMYAQRLDHDTALTVREAEGGETLVPGLVLIAPGDKHMRVIKRDGLYVTQVEPGPKVNGHCPSVEVLFNSVADAAGADAVGIILTGMGRDGATGLKNMRDHGAFTIGQDEETCIVYGMPKVAFEENGVVRQAPLPEIPQVLLNHLQRRK